MPLSEEEIKQRLEAIAIDRELEAEFEAEEDLALLAYDIDNAKEALEEAKNDYALHYHMRGLLGWLRRRAFAKEIAYRERRIEKLERKYRKYEEGLMQA